MKDRERGEIFTTSGAAPTVRTFQEEETKYRSYLMMNANLQYTGRIKDWNMTGSIQYSHTGFDRLQALRREGFGIDDNRRVRNDLVWAGGDVSKSMADRKLFLSLSDYVTFINYRERSLESGRHLSSSRDTRNRFTAGLQYNPTHGISIGVEAGANVIHNSAMDCVGNCICRREESHIRWEKHVEGASLLRLVCDVQQ